MTRRLVLVVAVAALGIPGALAAQSVDDVVAKYLAAKGGVEKLRAVESVRTTGKIRTGRGELPVTTWTKRPNMMRREIVADGQTQVVAFDGKTLWGINPLLSPTPREITGPGADRTRQDADDFDSVLLDYKQKGYTVELVAPADPGPRLRVTKKNGGVMEVHLNPQTFLEDKITMEIEQAGKKALVATELSDYRTVDGMKIPFKVRQVLNGVPQGEATYEQVQFNLPIGDELFKMPAK